MSLRHTQVITVLLAVALPQLAFGAVDAPIKAVTIYADTAMIQREAEVASSNPDFEIGGLPTGFDVQDVRIEASEGIHVGQISFHDSATLDAANPREAALEAKIQDLRDKEADLDIEAGAAQQVKALLSRLGTGGGDARSAPMIDAHDLPVAIEAVRKGMTDALTSIRRVDMQKRGLEKQIQAAQQDLTELRTGRRTLRTLSFPVVADHPGKLLLSYPVSGADWSAKYRALLDTATGKVTLERQALISQRTGEDWHEVHLRLSTGEPSAATQGPEPLPWMLDIVQPELDEIVVTAPSEPVMAAAAPAPMAVRPAPPPPPKAVQTAFATEFDVAVPVTLLADGSETTIPLEMQNLDAQTRLRTTPRLEAAAYVEVEAPRPEGVWLPGAMQLVRDGDYVGVLHWRPGDSDKLLLSFGRDDRVRVTYKRGKINNGSGSFIDSHRKREVTNNFTVTSSHTTAYPLLVLEPSPVSSSDQIKVDKEFTPKPDTEKWDDRTGVVAWQTTLQPKAKLSFEAHYTVSYPKDKQVIGLP